MYIPRDQISCLFIQKQTVSRTAPQILKFPFDDGGSGDELGDEIDGEGQDLRPLRFKSHFTYNLDCNSK